MTANKLATLGAIAVAGVALWLVVGPKVKASMTKAQQHEADKLQALGQAQSVLMAQWGDLASVASTALPASIITGL